jgi:hypothetical protein
VTPKFREALEQMARARGAVLRVTGDRISVATQGRAAELDLPGDAGAVDALADLPSAFPSRAARGDIREKTLYNIIQDMVVVTQGSRPRDTELQAKLPQVLHADPASRQVLASVMARQYWFHPKGKSPSVFLTPFHADLPGEYDYVGRYKSFRGSLLLFLCFDGNGFDLSVADEALDFMQGDGGLSPLDRELLRAAREVATSSGLHTSPDARRLLEIDDEQARVESRVRSRLSRGAFDQDALDLIRRDLRNVMTLQLPRHDKVAALMLALSVHVALYYYRIAFSVGEGLQVAARTLDGDAASSPPLFDGAVLFRVGSAGDRPISATDPCARAWWRLDEQHLLALPANMIAANLLHSVTEATLGDLSPVLPRPAECARALADDPPSIAVAEFLSAAIAARLVEIGGAPPPVYDPGAGGYALRMAALDVFRGRASALRQRGRDVVNTMVGGFAGSLKRNRGPVRFFELDEQVLFLLVKLILDGSGLQQMPLQKGFLPALRAYGLAPQDAHEEDLMADALQRLGLLDRYSDAGEATYVRHVL